MKKFFLITCFFAMLIAHGQNSGKVIYGEKIVGLELDTAKIKRDGVKSAVMRTYRKEKRALKNDRPLYTLVFNKNESLFQALPLMGNDAYGGALKRVLVKGKFYTNLKTNIHTHQLKYQGKIYLIAREKKYLNWHITNETKTIAGYRCQKAISTYKSNSKASIKIEAWFCPSLPFQFGPKYYYGLPGLILALKEHHYYFYAKKIILKNESVKKPTKGKRLSYYGFDEMIRKMYSETYGR